MTPLILYEYTRAASIFAALIFNAFAVLWEGFFHFSENKEI